MNKLYIMLLIGLFAWSNPAVADDVYLGYCDGNYIDVRVDGFSGTDRSAAVCFDKNTFWMYEGSSITGVRLGFGSPVTNLTLFIRNTLNGEDLYTQYIGAQPAGWNDISLTSPFPFPAEDFYIAYSCKGAAAIALSGETDPNGCWVKGNGEWKNCSAEDRGSVCLQTVVDGMSYTMTDAGLRYIDPVLAGMNETFVVTGNIRNNSNTSANTLTIEYTIDGGDKIRKTATTEILAGEMGRFSFEADPLPVVGEYTMEVTVVEINGVADEYIDNSIASAKLTIVGKAVSRKVLLEYFTTTLCPNCPAAQAAWKKVMDTRDDIIWVSHHAGYYTDIFTIKDNENMLWFYNAGGNTYAPASMLDRTNLSDYGASNGNGSATPGPVFFANNETSMEALTDARSAIPAPLVVEIERNYDASTRKLILRPAVEIIEGMTIGDNPVLNIFLIENGLVAAQQGGSSNFVHDHVVRQFVTPTWGDAIRFTDNRFTREYTLTVSDAWVNKNMEIVAFVSNYNPANANDCEVYNAVSVPLEGSDFTAIDKPESGPVMIYPNPSDGQFRVDMQEEVGQIEICDLTGSLLYQSGLQTGINEFSLSLPEGVYLATIISAGTQSTHKIVIRGR